MLQQEALDILKTGANVFLTGEPGAGKTHTINIFVAWLRSHGIEPAITASTGIAATHISGMTLHAWSGLEIRERLTAYDLDYIAQNKRVVSRVTSASTLIIDEVSMLGKHVLGMVDMVCKEIRRDKRPFGGLQVVFVGDFFQLPPIVRSALKNVPAQDVLIDIDGDGTPESNSVFAFRAPEWRAANPLVCYLTEQHRQEDETFGNFLSAMRSNVAGENEKQLLRTRYAPHAHGATTQLFSHNVDVDRINNAELDALDGDVHTFTMTGRGPKHLVASLTRGCTSPETLRLKTDARVMFTRNDSGRNRYVNGTLGVIETFDEKSGYPVVRTRDGHIVEVEPTEWRIEDGGKSLAQITQVPLRLAWAITVHKSQGMSLDAAHVDLSHAFEYGQGYVALSRLRTLSGLTISGLNEIALQVHPEVHAEDERFRAASEDAETAFTNMKDAEKQALQKRFIESSGGSINVQRIAQQQKEKRTRKTTKGSTYDKTLALLNAGKGIPDIAKTRGLTDGTVWGHVRELYVSGKISRGEVAVLLPSSVKKEIPRIKRALKKSKDGRLTPVFDALDGEVPYEYVRIVQLISE